ncbi:FHA domain-containing protein [Candidatus Poriferisodalis sp.]|uniref:FHA domain-containing protein n=1 Tax=Candidatus Poriferisodalis sp. TaxID=3101277 RepID=UPI003B029361
MSEQLVRLLSVCVLVLMYLFLFRVLRAVWASVAIPRHRTGQQSGRRSFRALRNGGAHHSNGIASPEPLALVVRSPLHAQGERHLLAEALTIGRSPECDVIIDDGYSSQAHARFYRNGGQHLLEDLGSTNGTYLNRQKVDTATVVRTGDFVQVGATVFEVST